MSEQKEKKKPRPKAVLESLHGIGVILARGIGGNPYLSTIALICVVFAFIACVWGGEAIFFAFLLFAFAIALAFVLAFKGKDLQEKEVQREEDLQELQNRLTATVNVGNSTIDLADKLDDSQKKGIRQILKDATRQVASELKIPEKLVRSNLFGLDDHRQLKMLHDLTYNMNREEELTISMPVGYGSTGRCFEERRPNIAVFDKDWGKNLLADKELRKVHPDLRWIISIPVPFDEHIEVQPIWVLNVDGLEEGRSEHEIQRALGQLIIRSSIIKLYISEAGERG